MSTRARVWSKRDHRSRSASRFLVVMAVAGALLTGGAARRGEQEMAVSSPRRSAADIVGLAYPLADETPTIDDAAGLEAFMDGVMTAQLGALNIAGAVVTVVKDGELSLAKGYGHADLEARKPVDAGKTLFRVGSVSKLFTWTAVMQLVEEGQLDLDADINIYLDFQVPATYPQPITLRHLMTHTPGFEDRALGLFTASTDDLLPLGRCLAENIPARVYPPGEIAAYSNYGTALAGYMVERVSGMGFEQYVEDHVFQPLGMARSTFRQAEIPAGLVEDIAVGYRYGHGAFEPEGPRYASLFPAGSVLSTATDMAKFMIAHLQNGQYGESRILQDPTSREMHRRHYANDPSVSGITLGFMESNVNGLRIIGHGGDTGSFHTLLSLIPEQNVGLFVAYSSMGSGDMGAVGAREDLLHLFLDRYYPAESSPAPQPPTDFANRAARFTGAYGSSRRNYSTAERVALLFQPLTVRATPEDTLLAAYGPVQMQLVETGPLEFESLEGQTRVVFRENQDGRIQDLMVESMPEQRFIRLPWYASRSFQLPLLVACLGLFIVALVAWSIRLLALGRQARASSESGPRLPRLARWVGMAAALLNIVFAVSIAMLIMSVMANPTGMPSAMPFVMTIPVATALLALGMLIFSLLAWKQRFWTVGGRLFYTLATLAGLVFVWAVNYWHLWIVSV